MLQHVDMKYLKEKCDIGDKDELHSIGHRCKNPHEKRQCGVCDMHSNICNKKMVEQIYVERTH